ncbi:MAG: hypothetical protein WBP04_05175, partial [Candidatus Microsaccharimonas sp.]
MQFTTRRQKRRNDKSKKSKKSVATVVAAGLVVGFFLGMAGFNPAYADDTTSTSVDDVTLSETTDTTDSGAPDEGTADLDTANLEVSEPVETVPAPAETTSPVEEVITESAPAETP